MNDIVNEIRRNKVHAGGQGSIAPGIGGTSVLMPQQTLRSVYVIRASESGIVAKEAIFATDRWSVRSGTEFEFFADPFPGYTFRDFERFVIADPDDPEEDEKSCLLLDDNRIMPPALAQEGPAANLWHGRIIAINLFQQLAVVAPVNPGVNPTNTSEWLNDENFNVTQSRCCWTQGFTGLSVDMPAVVTQSGNAQDLPWIAQSLQITRSDLEQFCGPQGPVAPLVSQVCTPPPNDPVCEIGACCVDGECTSTTSVACEDLGGTFYEGLSCTQAAQQHPDDCSTEETAACCLPDGSCFEGTMGECNAAEGTWQQGMDCGAADCQPAPVVPCCVAGNCIEYASPGECLQAGGTIQAGDSCNGVVCEEPVGCCVSIAGTTASVTEAVCNALGGSNIWLPCDCSEIEDPFNPICP